MSKDLLYEIALSYPSAAAHFGETITDTLSGLGLAPGEFAEACEGTTTKVSFFVRMKRRAETLRRRLEALVPEDIEVSLRILPDAEWRDKWKEGVRPFYVTRHFRVVPQWLEGEVAPGRGEDLFIDAGMTFGMGLHPTTRSMARFIETKRGRFETFLDIGAGTGILSIIAGRCGARRIVSIDISADAVKNARRNFARNRCNCESPEAMDFRNFRAAEPFDFVAANLLVPELVALRDRIIACVRPGKYLAVSGIWGGDYERFRRAFAMPALRCLRVLRAGGWISLLYRAADGRDFFTR